MRANTCTAAASRQLRADSNATAAASNSPSPNSSTSMPAAVADSSTHSATGDGGCTFGANCAATPRHPSGTAYPAAPPGTVASGHAGDDADGSIGGPARSTSRATRSLSEHVFHHRRGV